MCAVGDLRVFELADGRDLAWREFGMWSIEPGAIAVMPLPKWIEHSEPGGVTWTTQKFSLTLKSASRRHPSLLT